MPFFLWLCFLTGQRLLEQHRRHLGAQGRDAGREISLYRGAMPETTTAALAAQLLGRHTSPSQAAVRAERKIRLQEALNSLDPIDREILPCATLSSFPMVKPLRCSVSTSRPPASAREHSSGSKTSWRICRVVLGSSE